MNKKCLLSIIVIFLLISRLVLVKKSGNKMEIQKRVEQESSVKNEELDKNTLSENSYIETPIENVEPKEPELEESIIWKNGYPISKPLENSEPEHIYSIEEVERIAEYECKNGFNSNFIITHDTSQSNCFGIQAIPIVNAGEKVITYYWFDGNNNVLYKNDLKEPVSEDIEMGYMKYSSKQIWTLAKKYTADYDGLIMIEYCKKDNSFIIDKNYGGPSHPWELESYGGGLVAKFQFFVDSNKLFLQSTKNHQWELIESEYEFKLISKVDPNTLDMNKYVRFSNKQIERWAKKELLREGLSCLYVSVFTHIDNTFFICLAANEKDLYEPFDSKTRIVYWFDGDNGDLYLSDPKEPYITWKAQFIRNVEFDEFELD